MEPNTGAAAGPGGAIQAWDPDPLSGPNPANHCPAPTIWKNRGQECLLLVPEPQGKRATEAPTPDGVGQSSEKQWWFAP